MNVRLLKKSEINTANAAAKKREIDEGVKLAKRIDGLRETLADETKSLEQFRVSTIANIKAETEPLEEYLGSLKKEVDELERAKTQALLPLDAEWEKLEAEKVTIEKQKHEVGEVQKATNKAKDEAGEELRVAEEAKKQAIFCEEEATNKLKDATIELRNAKELKEQAGTTKREADIYKNDALATVAEEQRKLNLRTKALEEREQKVRDDETEISKTKLWLADQRATLGRALKRKS
jgi:chromosome segregation ATPase